MAEVDRDVGGDGEAAVLRDVFPAIPGEGGHEPAWRARTWRVSASTTAILRLTTHRRRYCNRFQRFQSPPPRRVENFTRAQSREHHTSDDIAGFRDAFWSLVSRTGCFRLGADSRRVANLQTT